VIDANRAWEAVPDLALLTRVLTRLRQWELEQQHRRAPGAPQFGVTCRRAGPGDPAADLTLPGGGL
jgi:hypothetical protein